MIILGIETSCDETATAIVKDGQTVLSSVIASSQEMHAKTGGIIPENAAREQIKSIIPVIEQAISKAKLWDVTQHVPQHTTHNTPSIDAIAVTVGPGLIGSLLIGVETARTLSWAWNKPLIPVNHLIGHLYANWIDNTPSLPAVALVVSGGHTDIVLMKNHKEIEWLGGTRDDAAGECFDKCARLLDLGFPGGPAIAKAAKSHKSRVTSHQIRLPRPLLDEKSFDFSFSGLKTAVLREVDRWKKPVLAYEIQEAITDVLVQKTLKAVKHHKVDTLLVAGGVAANSRLKEKFELEIGHWKLDINLHVPPPKLCTDNAIMIASAAFFNNKPIPWEEVSTNPSLTITQ